MTQSIALLLALILWLTVALPVTAADFCRRWGDHTVCIVSIKRSAKNYWEYRAAVRIDDIERPIEVYNCRDRIRVQSDGAIVPFEPQGAGQFICTRVDR